MRPRGSRIGRMTRAGVEPPHLPAATEGLIRRHAGELVRLAQEHGLTEIAFASAGRLRAHVADDRDLWDVFEFQRAAIELLGADLAVYSDGALSNNNVSPDLVNARSL